MDKTQSEISLQFIYLIILSSVTLIVGYTLSAISAICTYKISSLMLSILVSKQISIITILMLILFYLLLKNIKKYIIPCGISLYILFFYYIFIAFNQVASINFLNLIYLLALNYFFTSILFNFIKKKNINIKHNYLYLIPICLNLISFFILKWNDNISVTTNMFNIFLIFLCMFIGPLIFLIFINENIIKSTIIQGGEID